MKVKICVQLVPRVVLASMDWMEKTVLLVSPDYQVLPALTLLANTGLWTLVVNAHRDQLEYLGILGRQEIWDHQVQLK